MNQIAARLTNMVLTLPMQVPGGSSGSGTLDSTTEAAKTSVTQSTLWTKVVVPISFALGAIVVIVGLYKVILSASQAKAPQALKAFVITLVVAALLFRVDLLFTLIDAVGDIVAALVNSVNEIIS